MRRTRQVQRKPVPPEQIWCRRKRPIYVRHVYRGMKVGWGIAMIILKMADSAWCACVWKLWIMANLRHDAVPRYRHTNSAATQCSSGAYFLTCFKDACRNLSTLGLSYTPLHNLQDFKVDTRDHENCVLFLSSMLGSLLWIKLAYYRRKMSLSHLWQSVFRIRRLRDNMFFNNCSIETYYHFTIFQVACFLSMENFWC